MNEIGTHSTRTVLYILNMWQTLAELLRPIHAVPISTVKRLCADLF
jgi:hypothetical protein